jgi:hypothetical protein
MDMRLSFILLTLTYLIESVFSLEVETRCRSYRCGALNNSVCTVEDVLGDGNYNYTLKDCADRSKQYCPWTSLKPGTNSTLSCVNNTAPIPQKR